MPPYARVQKSTDIELHMTPQEAEAVRMTLHYALLREYNVIESDDPRIGGDPTEIEKVLQTLNGLGLGRLIYEDKEQKG